MWEKFRNPIVSLVLAGWFFFLNSAPAVAGLIDSKPANEDINNISREEDIKRIQRALESKMVQEKLKAYGLSKEEVEKKLSEMDDHQIHMLAKASEKVLAGGDSVLVKASEKALAEGDSDLIMALLVITILFVILPMLVLFAMNTSDSFIIIKWR